MKRIGRTSTAFCASLAILICGTTRTRAIAQEPTVRAEKFLEPDLESAKGNYISREKTGALEALYQGTASIPHGTKVLASRPPCQGTGGATTFNWSSCGIVTVNLPANAKIDSVAAYARNGGTTAWYPCYSPAQDCAVGWATFVDNYQVNDTPTGRQVQWVFSNWSHMLGRDALIVVIAH
jgi:hypothetical protein